MYHNKDQRQNMPQNVQDNIIQNIQKIFPRSVSREFIRNALVKENWDLEKSLRFIHAAIQSSKNAKGHTTPKKNVKERKDSKTLPHLKVQNFSKGQNKPQLFKKAPKSNVGKLKECDGWLLVDEPSCSSKATQVNNSKLNQGTSSICREGIIEAEIDEMKENPSIKRRKRRAQILQNYEIIKLFGEPSRRVTSYIKDGIKVMILMRGCSGSGKSTFAKQLLLKEGAQNPDYNIFSTDKFFINNDGSYCFNVNLLKEAHDWNKKLVEIAAAEGRSPIFVDNTHTQLWEMKNYAKIAVLYGYILETLEPPTPWFFNEDVLYRRSTHSIPKEKIRDMLHRYEPNLSGEDVLRLLNLRYVPPMIPPLGAMAELDFPLSKKHLKVLQLPLNKSNLIDISNSSIKTQNIKILPNKPYVATKPLNCQNSQVDSELDFIEFNSPPSASDSSELSSNYLIQLHSSDNESSSSEQPISDQRFSFQREESDSESDEILSSSSGRDLDDSEDTIIFDEGNANLEYILVSSDNSIIFQKYHTELKHLKTLDEFRLEASRDFAKEFNDQLSELMKSSYIGSKYGGADEATSIIPDASISERPVVVNDSSQSSSKPLTNFNIEEIESRVHYPSLDSAKPKFDKEINVTEMDQHSSSSNEKKVEDSFNSAVGVENIVSKSIETLHGLFPKVSKERLQELFGYSLEDLDWAISVLLESGQEMADLPEETTEDISPRETINKFTQSVKSQISHSQMSTLPENIEISDKKILQNLASTQVGEKEFSSPNVPSQNSVTPKKSCYIGNWDFKKESPKELPIELPKIQRTLKLSKSSNSCDTAVNTNYADFDILRKVNNNSLEPNSSIKVISVRPFFIGGMASPAPIQSVLMFDKGSMTSTIETNHVLQFDSGIERLAAMFPRVSRENLEELFEKCQKDIDWAAGLLLDSGQEMSELFTSLEPIESCGTPDDDEVKELSIDEESKSSKGAISSCLKKKKKVRHSKSDNDVYKKIQNDIQSNFVLDEKYYSSERMKKHFLRKNLNKNIETNFAVGDTQEYSEPIDDAPSDSEEDVVFMMDQDFIFQLQSRFGGLLRPNMIGEKTVVKLPLSLARQFHSYVMDSIHEHIEEEDVFTDEDEEYAKHLQEEELRTRGTPSLLEIMDEEVALRKSQKDFGNGRSVASTLSKQLLIERFPKMDPSTLASILEDTNHSLYQATCLLSSAGHQAESGDKGSQLKIKKPDTLEMSLSREEAIKQANAYGDVASQLYEMRKDCLKKSQKAYREGNHSVALYYSEMARWYMERIEKANSMAAKAILTGYEGWTTLDLHFLHVGEALNVLDLFIDEVIRVLQESNKRKAEVFIITGRGLHSNSGRPVLKPAVQARLAKRDLRFCELNPGMLKVTISQTALSSYKNQPDC